MAVSRQPQVGRGSTLTWLIPLLLVLVVAVAAVYVSSLSPEARRELLYHAQDGFRSSCS